MANNSTSDDIVIRISRERIGGALLILLAAAALIFQATRTGTPDSLTDALSDIETSETNDLVQASPAVVDLINFGDDLVSQGCTFLNDSPDRLDVAGVLSLQAIQSVSHRSFDQKFRTEVTTLAQAVMYDLTQCDAGTPPSLALHAADDLRTTIEEAK